jgi:hypothetical protein
MAGFPFRVGDGGTRGPADAQRRWGVGRIHARGKTLQVIGRRDDDADASPVLVVEDVAR